MSALLLLRPSETGFTPTGIPPIKREGLWKPVVGGVASVGIPSKRASWSPFLAMKALWSAYRARKAHWEPKDPGVGSVP